MPTQKHANPTNHQRHDANAHTGHAAAVSGKQPQTGAVVQSGGRSQQTQQLPAQTTAHNDSGPCRANPSDELPDEPKEQPLSIGPSKPSGDHQTTSATSPQASTNRQRSVAGAALSVAQANSTCALNAVHEGKQPHASKTSTNSSHKCTVINNNNNHVQQQQYNNTSAAPDTSTANASASAACPSTSSSSDDSDDDDSDSSISSSSSSTSEHHMDEADAPTTKKKTRKPDKIPQFSVKQSDTGGLRMKFALSASNNHAANVAVASTSDALGLGASCSQTAKVTVHSSPTKQTRKQMAPVSSSSCCSKCSDSDSDSSDSSKTRTVSNGRKPAKTSRRKSPSHVKKLNKLKTQRSAIGNKRASNGASVGSVVPAVGTGSSSTTSTATSIGSNSSDSDDEAGAMTAVRSPRKAPVHKTPLTKLTITTIAGQSPRIRNSVPEHLLDGTDGASSSDMELPALVNAAILSVENFSDDCESTAVMPVLQYRSSLLQDFCAKSQMLQTIMPPAVPVAHTLPQPQLPSILQLRAFSDSLCTQVNGPQPPTHKTDQPMLRPAVSPVMTNLPAVSEVVKRKRGRPRKVQPPVAVSSTSPIVLPSESPDSGITSITHSPLHLPGDAMLAAKMPSASSGRRQAKNAAAAGQSMLQSSRRSSQSSRRAASTQPPDAAANALPKLNLSSLEKSIYATERILYPPRRRKHLDSAVPLPRSDSPPTSFAECSNALTNEQLVDPAWRRIDINQRFRRPSTNGYRSDSAGPICSRLLAAQSQQQLVQPIGGCPVPRLSGCRSEYGGHGRRLSVCSNGNRSIASHRSRRSSRSRPPPATESDGYRSDYSFGRGARTCGYRSDASSRTRSRSRCRRHNVAGNMQSPVIDQDIMRLAGLSLGHSEESSRDSTVAGPETPTTLRNRKASGSSVSRKSTHGSRSSRHVSPPAQPIADRSRAPSRSSSRQRTASTCSRLSQHFDRLPKRLADAIVNRNSVLSSSSVAASLAAKKCSGARILERRLSVVSHCSSNRSVASSRYPSSMRRQRRRRAKFRNRMDQALSNACCSEIEALIELLDSCRIVCGPTCGSKSGKQADSQPVEHGGNPAPRQTTQLTKRANRKRKAPEIVPHDLAGASGSSVHARATNGHPAIPSAAGSVTSGAASGTIKRGRGKKAQTAKTQSPDDHKLPLKKRHYLLTSDGKQVAATANETIQSSPIVPVDERIRMSGREQPVYSGVCAGRAATKARSQHDDAYGSAATSPMADMMTNVPASPNARKSSETSCRKKHRLEGLLSKIRPSTPPLAALTSQSCAFDPLSGIPAHTMNNSATLRSTGCNQRTTAVPTSSMSIVPPPGIFEPSVDLELQIPQGLVTKTEIESPRTQLEALGRLVKDEPRNGDRGVIESLLNKTGGHLLVAAKRKRRTNKTGFPTVRRRKRKNVSRDVEPDQQTDSCADRKGSVVVNGSDTKPLTPLSLDIAVASNGIDASSVSPVDSKSLLQNGLAVNCDRVPMDGEAIATYIERNSRPRLSVVSLERLQGKVESDASQAFFDESRLLADGSLMFGKFQPLTVVPLPSPTLTVDSVLSDNEPLIRLVNRRGRKRTTNNRQTTESPAADDSEPIVLGKHFVKNPFCGRSRKCIASETPPPKPAKRTAVSRPKSTKLVPVKSLKSLAKTPSPSHRSQSSTRRKSTQPPLDVDKYPPEDIKPFDPVDPIEHDPLPLDDADWHANESPAAADSEAIVQRKPSQTRWKRRYLKAGLFSDYYKVDASERNVKPDATAPVAVLPAPIYCEAYFRRTQIDFRLPFDLWQAHAQGKLPSRHSVPSWNFKKIRTNVYTDVRPPVQSTIDQPVCSCKPAIGCGDDCLNRLMYTECTPKTCPCAEKCRNTDIQRHVVCPGIERFMTADKGWGVRTRQPIRKGIYILEYAGEVVTESAFKERMATVYTQDTHHYCLHLDGGLVIDGHRMGSDCRFVNHSCAPNCEMQKWSVNGLFRMVLFSLRDIQPDEELTYDYNFALFNPAEGQQCRCGSEQCRGVIGGKSQRVKLPDAVPVRARSPGATSLACGSHGPSVPDKAAKGRPRKNKANKNVSFMYAKCRLNVTGYVAPAPKELGLIRAGHCFQMRNIAKMRRVLRKQNPTQPATPASLTAQISALRQPRNIRTRGITTAEHDPVIERTARIAGILREICQTLGSHRDESGQLCSALLGIPSRKRNPAYFERIERPVDLAVIEANVEKGTYTHPSLFDEDVLRMFANAVQFYGAKSTETLATETLLSVYVRKKTECMERLTQIVPVASLGTFVVQPPNISSALMILNVDPNEDIIRCICGLYVDEGLMIQCAKCLVWQHTHCTGADPSAEQYLCDQCDPEANMDMEIRLEGEVNAKGYPCYLSLMRGELQVRQTDTVYVLRDIPIVSDSSSGEPPRKHTYQTIGQFDFSECDIFRIEQLWKDPTGRRFVYGHHYLRPHETYHEPTRKFYPNEVMRVPLYEEVPIEMIMGRCWVLDTNTFCKGRPVDSVEEHVYICELRVDKSARSFTRIGKTQNSVCQKSYAFRRFEQKLKVYRSYMPHNVDHVLLNKQPADKKKKKSDEALSNGGVGGSMHAHNGAMSSIGSRHNRQHPTAMSVPVVQLQPLPPKVLNVRRARLETQLVRLQARLPALADDEQPMNLTYLLTGRGTRRRTNANSANNTNNVPV